MKSKFPSIELLGVPLVLDASALINLLGTGICTQLLRSLALPVLVTAEALGEVRRHPIPGEALEPAIGALVSERLIESVQLSKSGRDIFHQLVADDLSGGLDDGEAATIAAALEHSESAIVVIDEKKAARIFAARWPSRQLVNTPTLLAQPSARGQLSTDALGLAVFSALKHARMRVSAEGIDWIVDLIGSDRARECASLGLQDDRLIRRRGVA